MSGPYEGTPVRLVDVDGNPTDMPASVSSGEEDAGGSTKIGGVYNSAPAALTSGDRGDIQLDSRGNVRVTPTNGLTSNTMSGGNVDGVAAGSNGFIAMAFQWIFNGTSWDRKKKPNATSRVASSAASINATVAKASAGDLFRICGYNNDSVVHYLKVYNKATAPAPSSDTALLQMVLPLPPQSTFDFPFDSHYFSTGIAFALTEDAPENSTTGVASGDILGLNVMYA